jgi:hypothetical protein
MIMLLKRSLKDQDLNVWKTAAIVVSKLYGVIPENAQLPDLFDLIRDDDPIGIANAAASLLEVSEGPSVPHPVSEARKSGGCDWQLPLHLQVHGSRWSAGLRHLLFHYPMFTMPVSRSKSSYAS